MVGLVAVSLSVGLVSPRPLLFRPHLAPAASLHGAANFAAASPLRGLRCSVETDESLDTAEPEPEVVVAVVADSVVLEDEDGEPLTVEEAENREISALALPALVNTLIDPILSLIDTVVISRLASTIALGAVAARFGCLRCASRSRSRCARRVVDDQPARRRGARARRRGSR